MRTLFLFLIAVNAVFGVFAQQTDTDSLWGIWHNNQLHDTTRLKAINDLAWDLFYHKQTDSAQIISELEYEFAKTKGQKVYMAYALNLQASCFYKRSEYKKALELQKASLNLKEEIGDVKSICSSLSNIGFIYSELGEFDKAIEYMEMSMHRLDEIGDKEGVLIALLDAGSVSKKAGEYPTALVYYKQAQVVSEQVGDAKTRGQLFNKMGLIYKGQGDYPKALENFQQCLRIREDASDRKGASIVLNNIGLIHKGQGDYPSALEYLQKSLDIKKEIGYSSGVETTMTNIGIIYTYQKKYTEALQVFQKVLEFRESDDDPDGVAIALVNIGDTYRELGDLDKAMEYFQRALQMREEQGDKPGLSVVYVNMGEIMRLQGQTRKSVMWCEKGLRIAEETEVVIDQHNACQCLYNSFKAAGNNGQALKFYEQMVSLKDSLFNEENTKKLTQLEMQYEFDKKEAATQAEQDKKDAVAAQELKRQKMARNGFMGGFAVVLLFAGVFFVQRNRIGKEKQRSEELLLNILPEEIAEELKDKGHSDAQLIESVTVLFTDFKGFTALSEKVTPKELVKDLHECFSAFDNICEKYGIEKIKTIGDAYMAAGGLPSPNTTHAHDVVKAALEMAQVIEEGKAKKIAAGLPFFEIRVGVHTGPVVAGIVGVKKFQYDIWGDTVNTASRMESSGEVGKVNVSQTTYELVKDQFTCEYRGEVEAKGKGKLRMYFVS